MNNPLLLGNTLTGTDDAKGAGVLIEGLPNSKNSQNFTLKPNDETSSYNDAEDDPEKTMEFITQIILMPTVVLQPGPEISGNIKTRW